MSEHLGITHNTQLRSLGHSVQAYVEGDAIYLDLNGARGIQGRIKLTDTDAKRVIGILQSAVNDKEVCS